LIYGRGSFVNNIMDSTAEGRLPGYTKYAVNVNYQWSKTVDEG